MGALGQDIRCKVKQTKELSFFGPFKIWNPLLYFFSAGMCNFPKKFISTNPEFSEHTEVEVEVDLLLFKNIPLLRAKLNEMKEARAAKRMILLEESKIQRSANLVWSTLEIRSILRTKTHLPNLTLAMCYSIRDETNEIAPFPFEQFS